MGKAAADTVEVEAQTLRRVEQSPGGLVQREPAGRRLLKQALAHQMPEQAVQDAGIAARRRGKIIDVGDARSDMVGDPQRRRHVHAPGRAEIAQIAEARDLMLWHVMTALKPVMGYGP